MSKKADALAVIQFEKEVHHAFTAKAKGFQELGRYRSNVEGESVQFPVFGYSMMHEHVIGQPIKAANGARTPKKFNMADWAIGDFTSIFSQKKINFNEQQEFAKVISDAMENRMMQNVIDGLAAATLSADNKIAKDVSGSADNLTVATVRAAANALDKQGVPKEGRVLMCMPNCVHNLTQDVMASSSDFINSRVMKDGVLAEFYGFKIKEIADMPEGGLPNAATNTGGVTDRKIYAFHKDAIGIATGVWSDADAEWQGRYGAWWVSGLLSGVAGVIDEKGVVEITVADQITNYA